MRESYTFLSCFFVWVFSILLSTPVYSQTFPFDVFKQQPEVDLTISESRITEGDSAVISWEVLHADTFYLKEQSKSLPLRGKMTVNPNKDILYRFVAKNGNKKKRVIRRISVIQPQIVKFTGPEKVAVDDSLTLRWAVKDVKTVHLMNNNKIVDSLNAEDYYTSGRITLPADSTTTYTLKGVNRFGNSVMKAYNVEVKYSLDTFEKILPGDTAVIQWNCPDAREVVVNGKSYGTIDSAYFSPPKSTNYPVYICQNNGDTIKKQIQVKLKEKVPRIKLFTGTETLFRKGKGQLIWMTDNANKVYLKDGANGEFERVTTTGEHSVRPDSTTRYTLKIYQDGKVIDEATHKIKVRKRRFVQNVIPYEKVPPGRRIFFEIFATNMEHYPDKVELYVLAVDSAGNFITHLAPPYGTKAEARKFFKSITEKIAHREKHRVNDFEVREVHQQGSTPSNTSLTLDYSGSMDESIEQLEASVLEVLQNKGPQDSMSIVRFDDSIALEQPLTADAKKINNNVIFSGLREFGGSTALYAAIDEGLVSLKNSSVDRRMLLFTDGFDNASFQYFGERSIFAQQVARKAKKANIKINPISYGEEVNESVLRFLAILTGGNYYNIPRNNDKDINKVMKELQTLNHKFYKITYDPDMGKNERQIRMEYADNQGNTAVAKRETFVGDNFDLTKRENKGRKNYWNNTQVLQSNKRPISSPQVLAKFGFNEVQLKKKYYQTIQKYIRYLENHPQSRATIIGHACLEGSDKVCDALSEKRAEKVYQYIVQSGIDKSRIQRIGYGKQYPMWEKEDKEWKALANRRVEIVILE